ncbi:hypothetical protein BDR26DRAFT_851408 [Obelidium mucronatum]|nr:hypothetical protein BDR26DRAFT_851408 [Obelidium mucronatum]
MLLSMNMSLFFATNAFYNTTRDSVLGQLTTLSLNCGQVIFAYYSWLRGYEVFKLQVSSTMIKCLRGMLCFIPVVCLGPNIVLLLGLPIQTQVKWFLITGAICAGSTISTDFVFSYSYIRHIWKMRCQKMDVKQQYYVISVYGLSANVFAFLALLCFVVMQLNAPSATPTMKALVINCIATMLFSCFLAVSVTLLVVMKVALVRPSVLSGQRSNGSAVKRFLEVTSRDDGSRLIANP